MAEPAMPICKFRCRSHVLAAALSIAATSFLVGCGEFTSTNLPPGVEVDTLAGGGLVVHNGSEGAWQEAKRWRLEEDLRIGQREGNGPDVFGRIEALNIDEGGRIWVADVMSADVRVFDSDGRPVRTIGRRGEGPGEFALLLAIARAPDGSMWVSDSRLGRIQVFDTAGELVTTHSFPRGASLTEPIVFDSSRLALHVARRAGALMAIRRDPIEFELLDTLPPVEPLGEPVRFSGKPTAMGIIAVQSMPFAHQPELRLQPGTSQYLGWPGGGEYRFGSFRLDGDTILLIERQYEPVAIPAEALEERLGHLTEAALAGLPRDQVPETYPPFDDVRVAPDGHWWVKRTLGLGKAIFEVFAPNGVFLGPVDTELDLSRFELMHVENDALYGVWLGPLDTPYVIRLSMKK